METEGRNNSWAGFVVCWPGQQENSLPHLFFPLWWSCAASLIWLFLHSRLIIAYLILFLLFFEKPQSALICRSPVWVKVTQRSSFIPQSRLWYSLLSPCPLCLIEAGVSINCVKRSSLSAGVRPQRPLHCKESWVMR